jgi:uncharacterized protein (TIGR02757 family)
LSSHAAFAALRDRLDALVALYDRRYLVPDPLELVVAHRRPEDREVVGFIAAALAYGGVAQIKRSVERVLGFLGPQPAKAVRHLDPREAVRRLAGFRHRFNDGRDVACLLLLVRQMLTGQGSIEGFYSAVASSGGPDIGPGLAAFSRAALELDHGGLYGPGVLPSNAGVRFFFCSPEGGSACKRLCMFLRWMVRRDGVDLGLWRSVAPSQLVVPLDAHVSSIARRLRLTRLRASSWAMALGVTEALRRLDPHDPIKYDFAFHRLGLLREKDELETLSGLAALAFGA